MSSLAATVESLDVCLLPRSLEKRRQKLWSKPLKEDVDFVCGGSIFVPDHPLASKVETRLDISCSTDVTSHYFASKRGLPLVCFKCGSASPFPVAEEVSSYSSSSLHILCAKNALRRGCVFALEGRSRCASDCQTRSWPGH